MTTNAERSFTEFGQSIWYDNVRRSALENGEFTRLVQQGVRGCTSNPSIFNKAIGGSADYDAALSRLAREGHSAEVITQRLSIADIQQAADQLRGIFDQSKGADGHVSIEVAPRSAHDVEATVKEAVELVESIRRDNLMIKVPATPAGLAALTELTGRGISVNVTLIFSRRRYVEVAQAYIAGLERALENGLALDRIASVASFFISRIDSAVDAQLKERAPAIANDLAGKIAIANAKLAYREFQRLYAEPRFARLAAKGARPQRLLWASTGTKNPNYSDTLYLDELIGRDTVNTVPPETLTAFQDHGRPNDALARGLDEAERQLAALTSAGIDLEQICEQLLDDGLLAFVQAMDELLASVERRRAAFVSAESTP